MIIKQLLPPPPISAVDRTQRGSGLRRIVCLAALLVYYVGQGANNGSGWQDYAGYAPGIVIDEENFPDEWFRNDVLLGYDTNEDGYLSTEEAEAVTEYMRGGVTNFKGIEYFTELEHLDGSGSLATEIDLSKNTKLKWLSLQDGQLKRLDLSKNTNDVSSYDEYLGAGGDANGDGIIDEQDLDLLRSYILGLIDISSLSQFNSDADGNGTVDIVDLTQLIEVLKK